MRRGWCPPRRLNPGLDFYEGDFFRLDLADAALAGIAAFYSLIHCARGELARAVAELYRVLQPGGQLLMAVHKGTGEVSEVRTALERAGFT